MKENIAHILKQEGYVAEVAVEGKPPKNHQDQAEVSGQEERDRRPAPRQHAGLAPLRRRDGNSPRARRPGRRRSSPRSEGVMTDTQARKKNLGGELLCYIW